MLASAGFAKQLDDLIHARFPIIQVVTLEEDRALKEVVEIVERLEHEPYIWSVTRGVVAAGFDSEQRARTFKESLVDFKAAIDFCENTAKTGKKRKAFVFLDPYPFLSQKSTDAIYRRRLREFAMSIRSRGYGAVCIIISPSVNIALELEKEITLIDFPLPDRAQITHYVETFIGRVAGSNRVHVEKSAELVPALVDACIGLTMAEIENCLAKALVNDMSLDRSDIHFIFEEKKQIIRKSGILEYIDTRELSIEAIGGLDVLKRWLTVRRRAFTREAQDYGLSVPKGVLLTGIPGCGKSLSAKCVSATWRMPLIKLDMGKIFSSLVGSSEENMRNALSTCEAIAPCVLWLDEIEKGLAHGSRSIGDSGVSMRVFGTLLTWMQEKKASVFIFATANDIDALPSEILRKGRFDEIFFVDLPTDLERKAILEIHIGRRHRNAANYDLDRLVALSGEENFGPGVAMTGAEIEAWMTEAMIESFNRKQDSGKADEDLQMADFETVIKRLVPLAKLRSEHFAKMRDWANSHAVSASAPEPQRKGDKSGGRAFY
jgi:ATP-dependent 26S proteasome regulatory subunit